MLELKKHLKWIASAGGPFVLIEEASLLRWHGNLEPESSSAFDLQTDYERACEVEDYVGAVSVDDKKALILALPNDTSAISINPTTFMVIRWIWGENEDQVIDSLREFVLEQNWLDTETRIFFNSSVLFLFDSALAGKEVVGSLAAVKPRIEHLQIETTPGSYSFSTFLYKPNEEVNLFLILATMVS